jgi:hypothetical protein
MKHVPNAKRRAVTMVGVGNGLPLSRQLTPYGQEQITTHLQFEQSLTHSCQHDRTHQQPEFRRWRSNEDGRN